MISVIIPVYNDPTGIDDTLSSLIKQDYASEEYEVIAVDNNSSDRTPHLIADYQDQYPSVVRGALETDIQGAYAARNTGIRESCGDIVAFMDADMRAPPSYLQKLNAYFSLHETTDYVGYRVEIKRDRPGFWSWYDAKLALPVQHYMQHKRFAPTCALAVRRSVFDEVGLFDARMVSGGDKEFGHRVHDAGLDTAYTNRIRVRHPARERFREQVKKSQRIGTGIAQLRERDVGDGSQSILPVPDEVLPPDPRTVWQKARDPSRVTFPFLYFGDAVISYLQLLGAVRYIGTRGAVRELSHAIRPPADEEGY